MFTKKKRKTEVPEQEVVQENTPNTPKSKKIKTIDLH